MDIGRGDATLAMLGLHTGGFEMVHVLLELRGDAAPPFTEYDPDAMHVNLVAWSMVPPLPDGMDTDLHSYQLYHHSTTLPLYCHTAEIMCPSKDLSSGVTFRDDTLPGFMLTCAR